MRATPRRFIYAIFLTLGLGWIFLSVDKNNASHSGTIAAPQTGFLAPDFSLQTTDGATIRLSDLRGQAALINLWTTWCPPCRAEMPAIEKIYNEYKDQGFIVLAINMTYQDKISDIPPFAQKYNLTFPILLDETAVIGSAYQLRSLPSSFFITREGVINEVVIGGPMAEALLRTRVEALLK